MALFAKFHLEPSIVNMYSEHLDRSADIALDKTVEEIRKIEKYTVNMIGDSRDTELSGAGGQYGEQVIADVSYTGAEKQNSVIHGLR